MLATLSVIVLGFLLGLRHAVDPDHVVAIGTIATRAPSFRRSAIVGALWGLGHTLTLLLVGGGIVLLRVAMPARTALAMEFAVAMMLIVLGLTNLLSARHREPPAPSVARPVLVGMVHGMAGSAAIALLVLATIRDAVVGLLYLLLFGFGTIAGMVVVTAAVVVPVTHAMSRAGVSRRWLTLTSGVVSIVFGLLMVHALGGPEALFASTAPVTSR